MTHAAIVATGLHECADDCRRPRPEQNRGSVDCYACGCRWVMNDISAENPIEDSCAEPGWPPFDNFPCGCHSPWWAMGYLGLAVSA